jgi:hypothetical protein
MEIVHNIAAWALKKRAHQIDLFRKYPLDVQREWFLKLLEKGKNTEYGKRHGFKYIKTYKQYTEQVPLNDYESLKEDILAIKHGRQNVLWPTEIKWFAKSSGTTADKSKFIPVSREALEDCHYKGGKDLLSIYFNARPDSKLFMGKGLAIGGSSEVNQFSKNSYYGDLSSIIIKNLPYWAEYVRVPSLEITLMPKWEDKLEKIAKAGLAENVTNISGVPSWNLILLERILAYSGKEHMLEVWPSFELYTHGGVSFAPYEKRFHELFPADSVWYLQTYNASEGFFGIQDRFEKGIDDMLLMLDYGIFYEFIPLDQVGKAHPKTIWLDDVEAGATYAVIITTNGGLWRYMLGDTVTFTSIAPYRIKVSGRTKYYINAFGEELMADNAEQGLKTACEKTGASVREYTAGPVFPSEHQKGGHQWIVEFDKPPSDINYFASALDTALKTLNSDYEAKRYQDINMGMLKITPAPEGTFYNWLKSKGKLGGQNKVPRLSNDRKILEELLALMQNSSTR